MATFNYKPSKPVALLSVAFGIGMIVFAVTSFQDGPVGFLIFWCCAVVAIVGLNVWAAFSDKGSLGTLSSGPTTHDDGAN